MKNIKLGLLGVVILGTISLGQTTFADEAKNTDVSVFVEAGQLKIKNISEIQFDEIYINGKDQDVEENEGANSKIEIEDFRGSSNSGWSLKAKLKDGNFNGLGLKLAPSINTNQETVIVSEETPNLNTEDILIASISNEKIKDTEFDTEILINPKLNIPAKTKSNTYKTTIIWDLSSTPETSDTGLSIKE